MCTFTHLCCTCCLLALLCSATKPSSTTRRGHIAASNMAVADVVIKQESVDAVDLEERIIQLCKDNTKGISDHVILSDMPSISPEQRVTAINRLLSTVSESGSRVALQNSIMAVG